MGSVNALQYPSACGRVGVCQSVGIRGLSGHSEGVVSEKTGHARSWVNASWAHASGVHSEQQQTHQSIAMALFQASVVPT